MYSDTGKLGYRARSVLARCLFVILAVSLPVLAASRMEPEDLPDVPLGPYQIGYTDLYDVPIGVNADGDPIYTNVSVYYPVDPGTSCSTTITAYDTYIAPPAANPPVTGIMLRTSHPAFRDCAASSAGPFPTIFYLHGGLNREDTQRFQGADAAEVLASYGMVYVSHNRVSNPGGTSLTNQARNVITYMTQDSPFGAVIDANQLGMEGWSAGIASSAVIAATNPAIRGVFGLDPYYYPGLPAVPVPVFTISAAFPGNSEVLATFATDQAAHLYLPRASHLGFPGRTICELVRSLREIAISEVGPGYEPLIAPGANAAGRLAYGAWTSFANQYGSSSTFCVTDDWIPVVPDGAYPAQRGKYWSDDLMEKYMALYKVGFWNSVFYGTNPYADYFDDEFIHDNFNPNFVQLKTEK